MPIMFTMKAAVAAAAVAVVAATAVTASAATEPVSNPRILVHYDLAAGQQPENVALEPDGNLDVVLSIAGQVERVTPTGQRQLLATLPAPSDAASTPLSSDTPWRPASCEPRTERSTSATPQAMTT